MRNDKLKATNQAEESSVKTMQNTTNVFSQILIPRSCVRMIFDAYHNLSHSGRSSNYRLISERF